MGLVQTRNNPPETFFRGRTDITAGVHDDTDEAEKFSTFEFVRKGVDGFFPEFIDGTGKVNQVAVVSNGVVNAGRFETVAKQTDFLGSDRFPVPLVVVLREQLDAVQFECCCLFNGFEITACDRQMRTKKRQGNYSVAGNRESE